MPEKIGRSGDHEEEAREGSSTPAIETSAVGVSADVRPRVADGDGEGTRATMYEGAKKAYKRSRLTKVYAAGRANRTTLELAEPGSGGSDGA